VSARPERDESVSAAYVVLDANDRVIQVGEGLRDQLSPFLGHVLWEHIPDAEPLFGPGFDKARETGDEVEFPVFYRGRAKRLRAVPAGDTLAVHIERLADLDVTTLGTLKESLRRIEAELAGPAYGRLDPRAPSSLRALP
jgi:hypothetical protein